MVRWYSESAAVFLLTVLVYLAVPTTQMLDSKYVLVVSQSLIDHGSFKLDPYIFGDSGDHSGVKVPHGMHVVNGHVYYWFPDGPAVLSVPYVAIMNMFGMSAIHSKGGWNPISEATWTCVDSYGRSCDFLVPVRPLPASNRVEPGDCRSCRFRDFPVKFRISVALVAHLGDFSAGGGGSHAGQDGTGQKREPVPVGDPAFVDVSCPADQQH